MSRLEEVKLRIPLLTLSESLQESLAVLRHELSSKLDYIAVHVRQDRMAHIELVWRVGSNIASGFSLVWVPAVDKFSKLLLKGVFSFARSGGDRRRDNLAFLGLLWRKNVFEDLASGEFFEFAGVVRTIRVIFGAQEVELWVVSFQFEDHALKVLTILGDIGRCLVDYGLDVWRWDDHTHLSLGVDFNFSHY